MKMVSGSTTYQIPFYTTTTEAGAYGTYGAANVGGTACYYGLGTGTDVAHGSQVKTPQKVVKGSTTYYMLTKGNAELATYTLKLNAMTTNQTITLKYKNRNITDTGYEAEVTKTSTSSAQSFTVRKGTTWTATVSPSTGWNAGALSPGSSGTVSAATTVSAAAATYKTFTLKLVKQTNQTITLKYKNKKSDGTFDSEVTKTSSSSDQSFTVGYGTTWTATIAGATGYNTGTLSPGASGTVTAATTVTAGTASLKTYTLKLAKQTNQTITLKYKNRNSANNGYETEVTKTSTSSDQSFTVRHGTTWTATIAGATGYNAGALSPGASGTVTAATTVTAGAASIKTFTVTVTLPSNGTIKVNNVAATSSKKTFTFNYNTSVTIQATANSGYQVDKLEVT